MDPFRAIKDGTLQLVGLFYKLKAGSYSRESALEETVASLTKSKGMLIQTSEKQASPPQDIVQEK